MPDKRREYALNAVLALGLLLVPLWAYWAGSPFTITVFTRIAIFALAAVGLNIALGLGGMVSFGHAVYFGVGGYVAGIAAQHAFNGETFLGIAGANQMLIIWPVAMIAAGLLAAVIGAFSLRTSGIFFIMITLAFAQMVYYFAISWPTYGGEDGLPIYVRNTFPGLNTMRPWNLFILCWCLLMLAIGAFALIRASRFGAALMAIRQNPDRVAAVGISPFGIKLAAFVISAMITGLAGALMADLSRFASPAAMAWTMSGELIVIIILGGTGRLFGPVAGAAVLVGFEVIFGGMTEHWRLWLGLVLLLTVLFARGGIVTLIAGRERLG
ncbi:branched-chain amino acid ABC transporter permease [Pararhodobacter aggregans]|uniref:Branched-chain amino acid ABC transporter permease n=1 Tax=Pararhodobacter aggregans TaxID=404875 RepID=A0A2T7UQE6_9RHOB|nr:branched-chain amino acid ABC transporter permease [Pararhodobacter aggregans]PTX01625.1 amino acid/amide ABC transporter membrane protein 2 (HAAT family) [Pararhodobacter aggregans]PVE46884.1 branched-chain amino acid ABC transporter permease [Pararhodobacter aggregans]